MAKIANVALTNTFETWRIRSNQSFDRLSQFAINNSSLYANNITANVSFTSTGLLTASGRATVGTNLTVSGNSTLGAAGKTVNLPGNILQLNGTDIRATFAQNTSVRLAIADRYQVANVNTLLATKSSWTGLLATNTAVRKLVADRYQVANVNILLAAKATWTGLTGTNTAIRTLVSDRLQVANASSTYLTKNNPVITGTLTAGGGVGTSGQVLSSTGTGIQWSSVAAPGATWAALTGTNTALRLLISDRLQVANASSTYLTKNNPVITGTLTAGGGVGTSGQVLSSTGTGIQWSSVAASGATWAALTGTNTALRLLISDRLQVANASSTYLTKNNPVITGTLTAGGGVGTSGQVLSSTGTGIQWTSVAASGATWSALTGTNTALRLLISDRYQVANVNTLLATKASWTELKATNTAIRALDTAKLSVANATILLATKASWTELKATNTAIRALDTAKLSVANAVAGYLTKNNPVITGTLTAGGGVGTSGQLLSSTGTGIQWITSSSVSLSADNTWTGIQTFNGTTAKVAASFKNIIEPATVSATAATGTIDYDVTTQSVLYYTTSASGNWTVNFRGSSGTSLNTLMTTGQMITVVFLVTQGATAYYNSAVTVDSVSVTPKYQGGAAWTTGNVNGIDIYTYTIVKTGSAAFTVFASQTLFK